MGWQEAVPALADWTERLERGGLTLQADLTPRVRQLVRLSGAVMRGTPVDMAEALRPSHGVTPLELSEAIFHLAFYCGMPRARQAANELAVLAGPEFKGAPASVGLHPVDAQAEEARDAGLREAWGRLAPDVVNRTNELFRAIWPREGLAKKDRSLLTITALITGSYLPQLAFHAERGRAAGITAPEIGAILCEMLFICGWPPVFQALPILAEVYAPELVT